MSQNVVALLHSSAKPRAKADVLAGLLLAYMAVIFIGSSWLKYQALHTYFFDFGIFQTWLYQSAYHNELGRMLLGHAHLAALPYIGLLRYLPAQLDAYLLLFIQAITLVIPVWFLYRRFGLFIAVLYALYAPVWILNHFDFHFDHLAVPLLLWFFIAAEDNRLFSAVIAGLLLLTVKETFALETAFCGIFLMTQATVKSPRFKCGVFLCITGVIYFYLVNKYVIPYFSDGQNSYASLGAYSWMGTTLPSIVYYILSHPLGILIDIITTPNKLLLLAFVFGSLAFVPLLAPRYLIPALPILAIALLAHLPDYYNCHKHHTAGLIIPVIFATAHGLDKAKKFIALSWCSWALGICLIASHWLFAPSPFSVWFWSTRLWAYNWQAYYPTARDNILQQAIVNYVPAENNIAVTTQTSVNNAHLAHRAGYFAFPEGIDKPVMLTDWTSLKKYPQYADYVILDLQRPWYISDKACHWYHGVCQDQNIAEEFMRQVHKVQAQYTLVFSYDGFMILKRKALTKHQ